AVGGGERERGAQGGARLAVPGARQEHRRHGAARQGFAPVARREKRRAGEGAERLHVVGDVVARELSAGLGGHGNGATEIKGQRRRIGEDAEHCTCIAAALECRGGGARHGGGGGILPERDEASSGEKR